MLFTSFSKTEATHACSTRFSLFSILVSSCCNPLGSRLKVSFPFMSLMNCLKDQWFRINSSSIERRVVSFLTYFGMTLGGSEEMGVTGSAFVGGNVLVGDCVPLPCIFPLPLP